MNQPYLGQKVAELRQQKNITQEQLAEKCEVSLRTIQRIEVGEVDPRAYTLQCLSDALGFDFAEVDTSRDNLWLAILHLSSVLVLLVIPLLIWSWKKDQSPRIDRQGRQVLNFQITMTLLLFAAAGLLLGLPILLLSSAATGIVVLDKGPYSLPILVCAPLPLILIGFLCTFEGILNAVRSLSGKPVHYPLSIQFVK